MDVNIGYVLTFFIWIVFLPDVAEAQSNTYYYGGFGSLFWIVVFVLCCCHFQRRRRAAQGQTVQMAVVQNNPNIAPYGVTPSTSQGPQQYGVQQYGVTPSQGPQQYGVQPYNSPIPYSQSNIAPQGYAGQNVAPPPAYSDICKSNSKKSKGSQGQTQHSYNPHSTNHI